MSIVRCDGCERFIDTDFDPAAYDEKTDRWLCEPCQEACELAEREEAGDSLKVQTEGGG